LAHLHAEKGVARAQQHFRPTYAIKQKSTGTGRGVSGEEFMAYLFVDRRF